MSTIKIQQLQPVGSALFQDSESFLQDLSDQEMGVFAGNALSELVPTLLVVSSIASISDYKLNNVQTKVTVSVAVSIVTASVVPMV